MNCFLECSLVSCSTVGNLRVFFDQDLSFNSHIEQDQNFLTLRIFQKSSTSCLKKILKNQFTHLYFHCNYLSSRCSNKPLKMPKLVKHTCVLKKRDLMSFMLDSPHLPPVKNRIQNLLIYKASNSQVQLYSNSS